MEMVHLLNWNDCPNPALIINFCKWSVRVSTKKLIIIIQATVMVA